MAGEDNGGGGRGGGGTRGKVEEVVEGGAGMVMRFQITPAWRCIGVLVWCGRLIRTSLTRLIAIRYASSSPSTDLGMSDSVIFNWGGRRSIRRLLEAFGNFPFYPHPPAGLPSLPTFLPSSVRPSLAPSLR